MKKIVNKSPVTTLFQKYLNNQINSEELQVLLRYFEQSDVDDDLTPLIKKELDSTDIELDELSVSAIANRAERRIVTDRTIIGIVRSIRVVDKQTLGTCRGCCADRRRRKHVLLLQINGSMVGFGTSSGGYCARKQPG